MPDSHKLVIETRYDAFVASIADWDGATPSFHECLASALFIAATMQETDRFLKGVADDARLSPNDVINWALGSSWFKESQSKIVASIAARLADCLAEVHRRIAAQLAAMNDGAPSADGFEE